MTAYVVIVCIFSLYNDSVVWSIFPIYWDFPVNDLLMGVKQNMRMSSLANEKEDTNQLTNGRGRLAGACVSWEYLQSNPFFFSREGANVDLVGQYRGATAFMISNGPSLASGRYDLNLLKSPGVITYGINNGPKTFRPNFWSCVDDPKRFLKSVWLDPTITKFVPFGHAEKRLFDNDNWKDGVIRKNPLNGQDKEFLVGDCPNVYYFRRNSKFVADRFLWENTFNWGNHKDYGGCRSVMLPVMRILFLLGFRRVFLLGADFNMSQDKTYHFDEQRDPGAIKGNMQTYARMNEEYFPSLKKYFDGVGFNVYNCTEGSRLTAFPFVKYEDAIADTISILGEVKNERTWGMYSKPELRQKFKEEPSIEQKPHLAGLKVGHPALSTQTRNSQTTVLKVNASDFAKKEDLVAKKEVVKPRQVIEDDNDYPIVPELIYNRKNKLVLNKDSVLKVSENFNGQKENSKNDRIIRNRPGGPLDILIPNHKNDEDYTVSQSRGVWIPDNGK